MTTEERIQRLERIVIVLARHAISGHHIVNSFTRKNDGIDVIGETDAMEQGLAYDMKLFSPKQNVVVGDYERCEVWQGNGLGVKMANGLQPPICSEEYLSGIEKYIKVLDRNGECLGYSWWGLVQYTVNLIAYIRKENMMGRPLA